MTKGQKPDQYKIPTIQIMLWQLQNRHTCKQLCQHGHAGVLSPRDCPCWYFLTASMHFGSERKNLSKQLSRFEDKGTPCRNDFIVGLCKYLKFRIMVRRIHCSKCVSSRKYPKVQVSFWISSAWHVQLELTQVLLVAVTQREKVRGQCLVASGRPSCGLFSWHLPCWRPSPRQKRKPLKGYCWPQCSPHALYGR